MKALFLSCEASSACIAFEKPGQERDQGKKSLWGRLFGGWLQIIYYAPGESNTRCAWMEDTGLGEKGGGIEGAPENIGNLEKILCGYARFLLKNYINSYCRTYVA